LAAIQSSNGEPEYGDGRCFDGWLAIPTNANLSDHLR
jgi:hypothetical protein